MLPGDMWHQPQCPGHQQPYLQMPAYATAATTTGQTESQNLLLQRIVLTLAQTLETLLHSKLHQRDTNQPEKEQEVTAAPQHPEPTGVRDTRSRLEMTCGDVSPALTNHEQPLAAPGVWRQCNRGIKCSAGPLPGKKVVLHNRWSPLEDQGQESPQDATEGENVAGEPNESQHRLNKKETDLVEKVETLGMNIKSLGKSIEGLRMETAEKQQVARSGNAATRSAKDDGDDECGYGAEHKGTHTAKADGEDNRGHSSGSYTNYGGWVTCAACARQVWLHKLPARHSCCRSCRQGGVHWQQIPPEAVARIAMAAGLKTAGQLAATDVRGPKIVMQRAHKQAGDDLATQQRAKHKQSKQSWRQYSGGSGNKAAATALYIKKGATWASSNNF